MNTRLRLWTCLSILVVISACPGNRSCAQVVDGWWSPHRDYTLLDPGANSAALPRYSFGTAGTVTLHFEVATLATNRQVLLLSSAGGPPVTFEILGTCDVILKPSGTNASFRFDTRPPASFSGSLKVEVVVSGRRCLEVTADELKITRIEATAARQKLSAAEAAELAARLANDQCERRFRRRPFRAEQHQAILQDSSYHWGGLDVGGPGGYSASVTFRQDGSDPHVEVYFSTDVLSPMR